MYGREFHWKYNVLVQVRVDPVVIPTKSVFVNDYDRIRFYYINDYHNITQYNLFYKHWLVFATVDEAVNMTAVLTFCKTKTEICQDFNISAEYVDVDKHEVYEGRNDVDGHTEPAPMNYTSSSNGMDEGYLV